VVQRRGHELKLVWPQAKDHLGPGHSIADVEAMEAWDFEHLLLQPLDDPRARDNSQAAVDLVLARPRWRLTLQDHKHLGLR
jgi:hypothetical protein